ncbi:Bug family tripartite tricarboxylate transporter substrate binding protein [Paeniroseomonas aquatica]|uniref:Tripartite tricarboxylate transporter substrate binding protein n=1 Tax=Paeniroseomonas aquatica TaxID=373043 RepID=A0ABT8A0J0_9PROT|nr:tripartite tricarboxylate transporter substrate binding protein [Paeniroseomonas aquatica]MDN3563217.1 tripartite tricarboxylate transporter substrate binding protein [Paeniroseomonas aquatica]
MTRRGALLAGLAAPRLGRAQEAFPNRPLRLVLPFGPGGVSDTLARLIAEQARPLLGQSVVIDPRPGSNGVIATEHVARAARDGYTVGYMAYGSLVTGPALGQALNYRIEDFQLLTAIFRAAQVLAVARDVPARSLAELVALSRDRPVAYGTVGRGGPGHILMEMLAGETGGRFENAVYRTEATVVQDMLGGAIPGFMGSLMPALEQHRAGGIRILAISTARRIAALPEVPSFAELGVPALTFLYCHGLAVPAGTPAPVVARLHAAFAAAIASEAVTARMTPDMVPDVTSPEAFTASIARETAALAAVIKTRGITAG